MHVGPGHPIFGPGRMGGGVGGLPGRGSLPPGARYDPINPAGLPGFHPDDFVQPGPPRPHPDVMQPGPGRGTDWDEMFG
jgi:proteasome inhibitor subunit 1 (PI31)